MSQTYITSLIQAHAEPLLLVARVAGVLRIVALSPSLALWLGQSETQMLGREVLHLFAPEEREATAQLLQQHLLGNAPSYDLPHYISQLVSDEAGRTLKLPMTLHLLPGEPPLLLVSFAPSTERILSLLSAVNRQQGLTPVLTPVPGEAQALYTMFDALSEPLALLDARRGPSYQRVVYANLAAQRLSGASHLAALEGSHPLAWPWATAARLQIAASLRELEQRGELELHLGDLVRGRRFHLRARTLYDPEGRPEHWLLQAEDVTQREVQARRVQLQSQAMQGSLRGMDIASSLLPLLEGLRRLDPSWHFVVLQMNVGVGRVSLVGHTVPEYMRLIDQIPLAEFLHLWRERDPLRSGQFTVQNAARLMPPYIASQAKWLIEHGYRRTVEVPLYNAERELLGVLAAASRRDAPPTPEFLEQITLEAGVAGLVLERDQQRRVLERLAYSDPLTGMLNRTAFTRHFSQLVERGQPFAVALMDLNRFKQINDSLGHALGDALLQQVALRLRERLRPYHIGALTRMGGDEFAFLLSTPQQLQNVNVTLEKAFLEPFEVQDKRLYVGVSVGWSLYPEHAAEMGVLLSQADAAMYRAKRAQVTAEVHVPQLVQGLSALALETALYDAINAEQFSLVYQPQTTVHTGRVTGAEVLLRWHHPEQGIISPSDFIPVAETTGLIVPLGRWVLRQACRAAADWPAHLTLSVNVSPLQVRQTNFVSDVLALLDETGMPPQRLTLEITESGLLGDLDELRRTLDALREVGIRVSIDDFGTGYSTLMSLRGLPADELKIDRTFIGDLQANGSAASRESLAIVQATVALARALNMNVVAEGVEDIHQWELLRDAGCHLLQGYLIAPGVSEADFLQRAGPRQSAEVKIRHRWNTPF